MAALTQIPKTNISVADIRDTLNANGGSVSNDTTTFFTTAAKINPFVKILMLMLQIMTQDGGRILVGLMVLVVYLGVYFHGVVQHLILSQM